MTIDGMRFGQHAIVVALGIDDEGHKHLLSLREGATENTVVGKDRVADMVARGFPAGRQLLFVLDGAKGLRKAVHDAFAQRALVQHGWVHMRRNVTEHLPDRLRPRIPAALEQAWRAESPDSARRQLQHLAAVFAKDHPSAAASPREGLEETLAVKRLGLHGALERTLVTTNPAENLNGSVRRISGRVRRCRNGQMAPRWVAAAPMKAERGFRRIRGYRAMRKLTAALDSLDQQDAVTSTRKAS